VVGGCPHCVFSADLDGDGKKDFVVANGSNNISVFLNNGDGTFQTAQNFDVGASSLSVFAEDLDGDGDKDLAVTSTGSKAL